MKLIGQKGVERPRDAAEYGWPTAKGQDGKDSPLLAMLALGGATVLLSELTSNTATAALMVPIAASLAPAAVRPRIKPGPVMRGPDGNVFAIGKR